MYCGCQPTDSLVYVGISAQHIIRLLTLKTDQALKRNNLIIWKRYNGNFRVEIMLLFGLPEKWNNQNFQEEIWNIIVHQKSG